MHLPPTKQGEGCRIIFLLQIFSEEFCQPVKGNVILVTAVVQIGVAGSGDNDKLLVVASQPLEGILAKVAGVGFFSVENHDRIPDFV